MAKVIEIPKSIAQRWSDLFQGRKIETFDDMFNCFTSDIDKVAAHQKAQVSGLSANDNGHSILDDSCGEGDGASPSVAKSRESYPSPAGIQPSGHVDEDGGFISDDENWRDEEPWWTDSMTAAEMWRDKGVK